MTDWHTHMKEQARDNFSNSKRKNKEKGKKKKGKIEKEKKPAFINPLPTSFCAPGSNRHELYLAQNFKISKTNIHSNYLSIYKVKIEINK